MARINAGWIAVFLAATLSAGAATPDDKPKPVLPRFVSMRHGQVNVRGGPSTDYPIAWVFTKQNLPVEIIQERDNWRKIRDSDGTEGWVNAAALQGRRFILVQGAIRAVRGEPAGDATIVARVEPGVLGKLDKCPPESIDWCQVDVGGSRGWLRRSEIWGVYPQEIYPVP